MSSLPWIVRHQPALILAPMEGITDGAMREVMSLYPGFNHAVTEFLRITQEAQPAKAIRRYCPEIISQQGRTQSQVPVQLQILGGDAKLCAETARRAIDEGVLGIDLNFGCPAPTVNRHDGGATLLKYPTRIFEMISTVRQAVPDRYPVSVKMRLGWDQVESIFENSKIAEEAGASWLTIHARTRMQSYQPPVHWSLIGEVRERLSIPVVANGDIWNFDDFKQCQRITGCEHYMIGRGVMGSPSLVFQIAQDLGILKDISENVLGGPLTTWPRGHWPEDPVLWKEFFTVVIRILRHHEFHDRTIIKRIKQWHKYAGMTRRQPLPWFDRIKVVDRLDVLMELMTDLKS